MIEVFSERPDDWWEVEALFDLCFAPGREALSSYRLRDGVAAVSGLSMVARDQDGILAGAIRFWPVLVAEKPVVLLGPVAVHPTHQGEGLGAVLMQDGLEQARKGGWSRVMLVGDAPYYGRYGFTLLRDVEMPPPTNPDRVLGMALQAGAWDNVSGKVVRWADPEY